MLSLSDAQDHDRYPGMAVGPRARPRGGTMLGLLVDEEGVLRLWDEGDPRQVEWARGDLVPRSRSRWRVGRDPRVRTVGR